MPILKENCLSYKLDKLPAGVLVFLSDYPEYDVAFICRVLAQKCKEGSFVKLSKGVYCKPVTTRFGPVYPEIPRIVEAIAAHDHAQVLPSGATAANILGLSEQVPMHYAFITSGSSRQLMVDGRKVTLLRAVPRNFSYQTRLAALIMQALKELGPESVGQEEVSTLKKVLDKAEEKEALRADIKMMPAWMRKVLMPLL